MIYPVLITSYQASEDIKEEQEEKREMPRPKRPKPGAVSGGVASAVRSKGGGQSNKLKRSMLYKYAKET